MERSFERTMVEQCAPTLAGFKAGSLFRVAARDRRALCRTVVRWNRTLGPHGVRLRIVKADLGTDSFLIYLYRPRQVEEILAGPGPAALLARAGYRPGDAGAMLRQLSRRLRMEGSFPHEVGVFLGYPLEDVEGFIRNKGGSCTCCGCWKAYGDPAEARARFARCRRCTAAYCTLFEKGFPITRLTVAASAASGSPSLAPAAGATDSGCGTGAPGAAPPERISGRRRA